MALAGARCKQPLLGSALQSPEPDALGTLVTPGPRPRISPCPVLRCSRTHKPVVMHLQGKRLLFWGTSPCPKGFRGPSQLWQAQGSLQLFVCVGLGAVSSLLPAFCGAVSPPGSLSSPRCFPLASHSRSTACIFLSCVACEAQEKPSNGVPWAPRSRPIPSHTGEQPHEHQVSGGHFFPCHQYQPCLFRAFLLRKPPMRAFSRTERSASADPHRPPHGAHSPGRAVARLYPTPP